MSWLRLDDGVVDNPKVQRLPLILFRAWINCICIAKKHGGVLPDMKDVAYRLHVTESRATELVNQLIEARLFDRSDDGVTPHDWKDWQFQSDSSTARVKRFREKNSNGSGNVSETLRNGEVETHQNRTETEHIQNRTEDPPLPSQPKLQLGEYGHVLVSHEEHEKLKALMNGNLDHYIKRFDEFVHEAPEAKASGVKRKNRNSYLTMRHWFDDDMKTGRIRGSTHTAAEIAEAQKRHREIYGDRLR